MFQPARRQRDLFMAQNTTIAIAESDGWTQLTDANVTAITFQVRGGQKVGVQGTVGASAPSDDTGHIVYEKGEGEAAKALSDLFPGVSGANRVYVKAFSGPASIFVSHA